MSKKENDKRYYEKIKNDPEYKRKKLERQRKWRSNNPDYSKTKRMEYFWKNQKVENVKSLKYFYEHREEMNEKSLLYYYDNRERLLLYNREYLKNNPRSSPEVSLETRIAMNNVRIHDNNTCQWYGCGKKYPETQIHVHHIFPRSEYPELETIEKYMICYCKEHHTYWHLMRGDKYATTLMKQQEELVIQ